MTDLPPRYLVIVAEPALRQLEYARAYIEAQGAPLAAERFKRRVEAAILSLGRYPYRGRPAGRGVRKLLSVYPYVIRYRITDDKVEVISIRHGARR